MIDVYYIYQEKVYLLHDKKEKKGSVVIFYMMEIFTVFVL